MIWAGISVPLLVILVAVLWVPQNAHHEGCHALAYWALGAEITKFKVIPTFYKNTWKVETFASMSYTFPEGVKRPGPFWEGAASCMPQIVNTIWLALILGIYYILNPEGWVLTGLTALYILHFVDGAWNLGTFYKKRPEHPYTDGWEAASAWGWPTWSARLVAILWHVVYGSHLFLPIPNP